MLGGSTSVQADVTMLATVAVGAILLATLLVVVRRLVEARAARPHLPEDDRPPAGLGRLVPVGAQVDEECRTGLAQLERWLVGRAKPGQPGT